MKLFKSGYLFKPKHFTINYLKNGATCDLRKSYSHNFTRDEDQALTSTNMYETKKTIVKLVSKFRDDDEYFWTPVLINVNNNTYQRFVNNNWLDEAISLK